MLPVAVGNGERLKQPRRHLVGGLVPLALVAGPHIFAHCLLNLGPIEVSLQAFPGFGSAEMSRGDCIMRLMQQLGAERYQEEGPEGLWERVAKKAESGVATERADNW
ncbi:hypothetical protein HaLaN_31878 [Haematococcus lacustris]|uniref:Uncharacterized protein n=1 Tax=Haematococcus lacustris TaxID=44745 RepID=A0A6A0AIB2_HAELA|nr:hypothetical protein HaLaN_31878 [Haematococcus lacustris]